MQYIDEVNMKKLSKVNTSSWEAIKNNVFFRVVNEKCLDKYGENIAYVKFLDLAITFSVQEKKQNTLVSHMLTKEELASFNVNVDDSFTLPDNKIVKYGIKARDTAVFHPLKYLTRLKNICNKSFRGNGTTIS